MGFSNLDHAVLVSISTSLRWQTNKSALTNTKGWGCCNLYLNILVKRFLGAWAKTVSAWDAVSHKVAGGIRTCCIQVVDEHYGADAVEVVHLGWVLTRYVCVGSATCRAGRIGSHRTRALHIREVHCAEIGSACICRKNVHPTKYFSDSKNTKQSTPNLPVLWTLWPSLDFTRGPMQPRKEDCAWDQIIKQNASIHKLRDKIAVPDNALLSAWWCIHSRIQEDASASAE